MVEVDDSSSINFSNEEREELSLQEKETQARILKWIKGENCKNELKKLKINDPKKEIHLTAQFTFEQNALIDFHERNDLKGVCWGLSCFWAREILTSEEAHQKSNLTQMTLEKPKRLISLLSHFEMEIIPMQEIMHKRVWVGGFSRSEVLAKASDIVKEKTHISVGWYVPQCPMKQVLETLIGLPENQVFLISGISETDNTGHAIACRTWGKGRERKSDHEFQFFDPNIGEWYVATTNAHLQEVNDELMNMSFLQLGLKDYADIAILKLAD